MNEPRAPLPLNYESSESLPIGPRPKWVWVVIGLYFVILIGGSLLLAWMLWRDGDSQESLAAAVTMTVATLCGLGLIFTPVRIKSRGRITRGSIWIPVAASGLLLGITAVATVWALIECFGGESVDGSIYIGAAIGGGAIWIGWFVFIWLMTASRDPTSVAMWLHRTVLGGSIAELLVAVPCHVVVRKRTECCAGLITGSAICIGTLVMFIAFGPSVVFLDFRRWQKISGN